MLMAGTTRRMKKYVELLFRVQKNRSITVGEVIDRHDGWKTWRWAFSCLLGARVR